MLETHVPTSTLGEYVSSHVLFKSQNLFIQISYFRVYLTVQYFVFLKENQLKLNISNFECFVVIFYEVITFEIFLAQQSTTKTDLRFFEKLGPDVLDNCATKLNFYGLFHKAFVVYV